MTRKTLTLIACVMASLAVCMGKKIELKDITEGTFAPKYVTGIRPLEGTDKYCKISEDGRQIIMASFRKGAKPTVAYQIADSDTSRIQYIDGYSFSPDGKRILIRTDYKPVYRRSFHARYFIYDRENERLTPLTDHADLQVATWSPDSRHVAYVRANNLYIHDSEKETQVTKDGKTNEVINGLPDWVYEEEFTFNKAFAWDADGSGIVWIRFDESQVKTCALQLFKGLSPERQSYANYPGEYAYKYPKAGEENSKVSVWSYELATGATRQIQLPMPHDGYIPRVLSTSKKGNVLVYTMNRHQDTLKVYTVNPVTTENRLLIEETVPKYVKEEILDWIAITDKNILLPSDRDGYMHLYLYDLNGQLIRQVEKGDYDVTDVYGYDEKRGDTYFQAAMLNPMDRQIYVAHKNGQVERLTDTEGYNQAIFAGDFSYFLNTWCDYAHPYVFTTRDRKGKIVEIVEDNHELVEKLKEYEDWTQREPFSFTTSEGVTLNGWMVKPANFDKSKKYPVILFQYSGPGNQQVLNAWQSGSMGGGGAFDYYLASQGYIIACVDGRGTGARGAEFEKCTYLRLGDLESKDQVETALYMGSLPYVDSQRIGIWGWSYGGFNTLMSMSEGRPVFRAGVAVAPPTNWKFYDTIYTERYMRTPQENAEGYKTNPMERASQLHGALLICHGVADDNVHPQNTFEYSEALVQADKDFKELFYVNRNHGISGGNTRHHLLRQITQWFNEHMK